MQLPLGWPQKAHRWRSQSVTGVEAGGLFGRGRGGDCGGDDQSSTDSTENSSEIDSHLDDPVPVFLQWLSTSSVPGIEAGLYHLSSISPVSKPPMKQAGRPAHAAGKPTDLERWDLFC